jgi:D-threonate/D-erythronate kinase
MSASIVIVADDLTGAADCGVVCSAAGLSTVVALNDAARAKDLDAEAIAFDADTRYQSSEQARTTTAQAVRQLCAKGDVHVLYKKIDSTLRGNFAIEIAAARNSSAGLILSHKTGNATAPSPPLSIVAPAFPATGRTTRNGRMFVQGVALEETEIWQNEKIGGVADIPALLEKAGMRAASIGLETIRSGVGAIAAALAKHSAGELEAAVCDAETEEDLRAIANAATQLDQPAFFAGSAGLARYLPHAFGLAKHPKSFSGRDSTTPPSNQDHPLAVNSDSPIAECSNPNLARLLFVIGSMSQISRLQVRRLAEESSVRIFAISPATLRAGQDSSVWRDARHSMEEAIDLGQDVGVTLGLGHGIDLSESTYLSSSLAQLLQPLVERFAGLFCTGGETARGLLNAAGAAGIRLVGEIEPGIPLGTAEGGSHLAIVTKAGAFGTPETLVHCRAALRRFLAQRTQT